MCEILASNKAFRIRITRSDLLTNGNPRIMFKHLKMNRVARQDGTNLRLDLGYTRAQIIDYINEEAQKVVVSTGVATDTSINTTGLITATRFIGDGSTLTGIVTNIQAGGNISVLESPSGNFIVTSTGGGGGSYSDSDVDTHANVSTANTDEILVYNGNDYEWKAPNNLGVTTATGVVRGFPTGVGNTTLRLVMTDSSLVDIDLTNLNNTSSETDINSRIAKAVSFARTDTSFMRASTGGQTNNMWDSMFRQPTGNLVSMGSAADTHVSNNGNAQPFAQTIIFRNPGINTDRDSVLVGLCENRSIPYWFR